MAFGVVELILAVNIGTLAAVEAILPTIPKNDRILIEAGTPFIKREGARGIERINKIWDGKIVADLKTID